jgi:hypothetical protein
MKSVVIKPDTPIRTVFLAGSIEMGTAEDWQAKVERELEGFIILNPRRDDWDSSWEQSIDNKQFYDQVSWELEALETADIILFYFSPGTMSPITLLELGIFSKMSPDKIVVCCPEGYWRKGNVDIVCEKLDIVQNDDLDDIISYFNTIDYSTFNNRNFAGRYEVGR